MSTTQHRNTFDYNFTGAQKKQTRVCKPHGGHRPPNGMVPCEWLSLSGIWIPVYVPERDVPPQLRFTGE